MALGFDMSQITHPVRTVNLLILSQSSQIVNFLQDTLVRISDILGKTNGPSKFTSLAPALVVSAVMKDFNDKHLANRANDPHCPTISNQAVSG
jgi:hypothetical protein